MIYTTFGGKEGKVIEYDHRMTPNNWSELNW